MHGKRRSIQALQKKIHVYKLRRKRVLHLYGSYSPQYKSIASKVYSTSRQLRINMERLGELRRIERAVSDFIGYKPSKIGNCGTHKRKIAAKSIFYKYAIESGFSGGDIARYIGLRRLDSPTIQRMNFTRSFKTNKENHEMWRRFKLYVKDLKDDKQW